MRLAFVQVIAILGAVSFAFCHYLIWFYAPIEINLGIAQKIFYIHLPTAWWALLSYFVIFIASIGVLAKQSEKLDALCAAAAEIGVLLNTLALLTGMVWGRLSWGVWWTWDPRLTTTLIMWFVYLGYLILRGLELAPTRKRKICAVLGIVAFLDVPLVFLSARLWRSIHPAVFNNPSGGLAEEMRLTVIACVLSFGLIWFTLLYLRQKQITLSSRIDALLTTPQN